MPIRLERQTESLARNAPQSSSMSGLSAVRRLSDRLSRLPEIYGARLSFQRDRVAFYWNKTGRMELYVAELRKPRPLQLSHGEAPTTPYYTDFVWDRAGRSLAFSRDSEGDEEFSLFRIDLDGGVKPIGDAVESESLPLEFSPDDSQLLVSSDRDDGHGHRRSELWRVDLGSTDWRLLTRGCRSPDLWLASSFWSPDSRRIVYSGNHQDDARDAAILVVRAEDGIEEMRYQTKDGSSDFPGAWHPDGSHISLTSEATGVQQAGVLDLRTGHVEWLGRGKSDEVALGFSPDGRQLAVLQFAGVDAVPIVYDLKSGEGRRFPGEEGAALRVEFDSTGERILFLQDHPVQRACIQSWHWRNESFETILGPDTREKPSLRLVVPEVVEYTSFDGLQIEALLYRPARPKRRRDVPALVNVHGGPTLQFNRVWDPLAQLLCALGFAVLQPNVRGSTGYGIAFRDKNRMDLGGGDLRDLVAATKYLLELGEVDPGRMGILGHSYGGYLAYLALTKTPRIWQAGCAIGGFTDWQSEYATETPVLRQYDRELMGDPVLDAPLWAERSPLKFADHLSSRLLILHGVNDARCPVTQARLFRDRLIETGRVLGTDFEYHEFEGQGHESADALEKSKTFSMVADFFVRVLQPSG